MKFLTVILVVLLTCPGFSQPLDETTGRAKSDNSELPAIVVLKKESRVYISAGKRDGVTRNWAVSRLKSDSAEQYLTLDWIGDDLCRLDPSNRAIQDLSVGDTVWLSEVRMPGSEEKVRTATWAVVRLPAAISDLPVTVNDWDFREAMYSHIGDYVEEIKSNEANNAVWALRTDSEASFSNDKPIDISSIQFSLGRFCRIVDPYAVYLEHFRILGDTLVCVKMNPFTLQTNFWSRCGRGLAFIDRPGAYVYSDPDSASENPHAISSGAFKSAYVSDSIIAICPRQSSVESERLDTMFLKAYGSYESAKLAFELGEVDLLDIAPFDVRRFSDGYEVIEQEMDAAVFLSVNNGKPYFADNLFGAALNYLIDKDALCRVPLAGMVEPLEVPPVLPDSEAVVSFKFDPNKGEKLLYQIDDLPKYMSLFVADASDFGMLRAADYLRGILARHNIAITIYTDPISEKDDDSSYFDTFDLVLARLDDPGGTGSQLINQSFFHSDLDRVDWNKSLFRSAEVERLFRRYYEDCFDRTESGRQALRRLVSAHLNSPSGVWLYKPVRYIAVSSRVLNLDFVAPGIADYTTLRAE